MRRAWTLSLAFCLCCSSFRKPSCPQRHFLSTSLLLRSRLIGSSSRAPPFSDLLTVAQLLGSNYALRRHHKAILKTRGIVKTRQDPLRKRDHYSRSWHWECLSAETFHYMIQVRAALVMPPSWNQREHSEVVRMRTNAFVCQDMQKSKLSPSTASAVLS